MPDNQYPMVDNNISREDRNKLEAITSPEHIRTVTLDNIWEDDHLPCVNATINGIKVSFWWLDSESVGAFAYADDSPKAKQRVFEILEHNLEILPWEEKTKDADRNGNTNALRNLGCPFCKNHKSLSIHTSAISLVNDNGVEETSGTGWWDENSRCSCPDCGTEGTIASFTIKADEGTND